MLQAGYLEDWQYHQTLSGAPQGGVISPILSNIVLHELDRYVEEELIPRYTQGDRRPITREYSRLADARRRAKASGNWEEYTQLGKQMRQIPSRDPYDPGYRRLRYVRYADDFLLGFIGPKAEAEAIKADLAAYLRTLGLTLSAEKTTITHAQSQRARFLGYEISVAQADTKVTKDSLNRVKRSINGEIQLHVPSDVVQEWVRKYTRKGKPTALNWLKDLSEYEIVSTYGAQLRGVAYYYLLAGDVGKKIGKVYWYGLESLRKTLCKKHKLTKTQSYRRYRHRPTTHAERTHFRVTIEREGKPPLVAKCGEVPLKTQRTAYLIDQIPPFVVMGTRSELVKRLLAEKCELCGDEGQVEVHHIKKVATIRKKWKGQRQKPQWVEFILARNRKTIIVCIACHRRITHGRYDGPKVS